jgi:hypothetical protein
MSYDLAVWEGERPADDAAAEREYYGLYERYVESDSSEPPTAGIVAYVDALLRRWPDLTATGDDATPWASGPLIGEAIGPLVYFPMVWSMADEASAFAAETAASMGLVCFDPQSGRLRS